MPALALCLLLVFAAPTKKQWSKAHGIGVTFPNSWTILERDQGKRAFVVGGPKLGAGKPRLVIWNGGPLGTSTLADLAKAFDQQVWRAAVGQNSTDVPRCHTMVGLVALRRVFTWSSRS